MPSYIVTEPSPSTTSYIRSGRGGAGNITRASSSKASAAQKTTTTSHSSSSPSRRYFSGIGGAGNVHRASEHPTLSLDEEYDRAAARDQANVGHCGIGGAGNVFKRKGSDASSQASSSSSVSSKSKMWSRVSATFSRD